MRSYLPLLAVPFAASAPALAIEPVPVPAFQSIDLRGGGEVSIRPGPVQRVALTEGSARITRFRVERNGRLRIDACDGKCPRHYRLRVEVQSPYAPDVAISGGGMIQASAGFPAQRQFSAAIMGGGKVDMLSVSAGTVNAAVHGGGLISVRAQSRLTAAVNGGGEVRYAGNPAVTSAVNGGGAVHRIHG